MGENLVCGVKVTNLDIFARSEFQQGAMVSCSSKVVNQNMNILGAGEGMNQIQVINIERSEDYAVSTSNVL
jgi:hypothetical protein